MIDNYQRYVLYNQFEILKLLDQDNSSTYEEKQAILEYGSDSDVEDLYACFEGAPEDVKKEVFAILEMYSALEVAQSNLVPDESKRKRLFTGFDGNYEVEHYAYCKHLIKDLGRYSEFYDYDLNSHCETLSYRRAMLEQFERIKHSRPNFMYNNMTQEEFDEITNC